MNTRLLAIVAGAACGPFAFADTVIDRVQQSLAARGFAIDLTYRAASDIPFDRSVMLTSRSAGIFISISVGGWPMPGGGPTKEQILSDWTQGNAIAAREGTLSGVAVGEHCVADSGSNGCMYKAMADRYELSVHTTMTKTGSDDELAARREQVRILCEQVTRRLLGEAMAMDLNDDGGLRATGHLTGLEVDKAGMVPLADWAQNRGISVAYDAGTDIASFTFHDKQVKLPLASSRAVVNGTQVGLNGKFIMARGSRWFVPGRELSDAIG